MADISMNITFRILFFNLNNIKISFVEQLISRLYIIIKDLFTTRQVEFNAKKEFIIASLNFYNEVFIIYVISFKYLDIDIKINFFYRAQIVFLKTTKTLISIFSKYANFINIFFKYLITKLSEYTRIKNQAINFVQG